MSKSKREIQREIYNFIADMEEPVILQVIIDKFSKKYSTSARTISRTLEDMCSSKNPFRLRTWYDGNRFYEVPMITLKGKILSLLSVFIPLICFFIDLFNIFGLAWYVFISSVFFICGFWIAMWLSVLGGQSNDRSVRKKSKDI